MTGASGAEGSATQLVQDFDCIADIGTSGCGWEQQLEAPLKALTPSGSSIRFGMGTVGHGDTDNAGFLRADSLLAILVVTDEDACTPRDPRLFDPNVNNATYPGDLNTRCFMYPDAVQLPSRYVDGFLALRQGDPGRLVFAVIAGVPPDLVSSGDPVDYDAILSDPRMQERRDPMIPTQLTPSCNRPGTGLALPPRRIVQVAQGLAQRGARTVVQTCCQDDYTPAIDALVTQIADGLAPTGCLSRPLDVTPDGSVRCEASTRFSPHPRGPDAQRFRAPTSRPSAPP